MGLERSDQRGPHFHRIPPEQIQRTHLHTYTQIHAPTTHACKTQMQHLPRIP